MEASPVSHNHAGSPLEQAVLSHAQAHELVADVIMKLSSATVCYWWKALGDDVNCICKFLDISWEEWRLILRKCRVSYGVNDSFRTSAFEALCSKIGCDYTKYRPAGTLTYYMKVGKNIDDPHAVEKPKDMYSTGGVLEQMPVLSVHLPGIRTKISRRLTATLIKSTRDEGDNPTTTADNTTSYSDKPNNKGSMTIYINDLINVIRGEVLYASRQGDAYTFTQRAERTLRKAAVIAIKGSLRDAFDSWVDSMEDEFKGKEGVESVSSTPLVGVGSATRRPAISARRIFAGTPLATEMAPLITPPLDLTDDVEEDESDINLVLTQIKEQTILQNLLHKRMLEKNHERVLHLEHRNGRKLRVFLPPESQSTRGFIEEAKRSGWIKQLLCTEVHKEGVLMYLAKVSPDQCLKVANQRKLRVTTEMLSTPQTLALGRLTGINDTQMKKLRSFLSHVGHAELKLAPKDINRIDRDVGLMAGSMPPPIFDTYTLEWSSTSAKGVEKKPPEHCSFWNSDLLSEVAAEIDLLHHSMAIDMAIDNPDRSAVIPYQSLDYGAPGFTEDGIVVLFGGDHGQGSCPCSLKLNFSSPQERKARGELNWRCPTIQIASIQCTKDSFELLGNAVMPLIKQQLNLLCNCSAYVVFDKKDVKQKKAVLLPKGLKQLHFRAGELAYDTVTNNQRQTTTINLQDFFDNTDVGSLSIIKVITNFHDLYVGDLAFLAMAVGMNNSSGAHCIHCLKKAREFNCTIEHQDIRTKASLTVCLNEYNTRRLATRSVRNHHGVNTLGLLDIDPQRIIVPILHCPMGLVDKVLETFKAWTVMEVEMLPADSSEIREAYKSTRAALAVALAEEEATRRLHFNAGNTAEAAVLLINLRGRKVVTATAKREERKARQNYDEMTKRHNAKIVSLSQDYDTIFRTNGIKKEHYHGGKYNGVNCIRTMDKADVLFEQFGIAIKNKKVLVVTDDTINIKCNLFARLLGLLDIIWSNVRGIEAGLLPTDAQVQQLTKALSEAKTLWLTIGMGTLQPKWHLTFDGHLLHQVVKCGGLADKSDDTIEFQHQLLMRLRDRYRSITSFQKREACIRRELRRDRSPEINRHIEDYCDSIRQKPDGKRRLATEERKEGVREAKRIKREGILDGP